MDSLQKLGVKPIFTKVLNNKHTKFVVSSGSLVDFTGEAIVNFAYTGSLGECGIDGVINARGGTELHIARESLSQFSEGVYCPEGEVKVTVSSELCPKYIIHVVGPTYPNEGPFSAYDSVLRRAYQNALVEGKKKGVKTIAFASLGTGIIQGGRLLKDILLIGVETVVQSVYDGLQELHMVSTNEKELNALLLTAVQFFDKQDSMDTSKKLHRRSSLPDEERIAKRQKTSFNQVIESEMSAAAVGSKICCGKTPIQGISSTTPGLLSQPNTLSSRFLSTPKPDLVMPIHSMPDRESLGTTPALTQNKHGIKAATPVETIVASQAKIQATPVRIKSSPRVQILLITMDEWFEHIFKRYLDKPFKILKCFSGTPLTFMQQRHIIATYKTIYPQLRSKLRRNMSNWLEQRNLVQLFADVDKMIATEITTPGGTRWRPPVESVGHLQAIYDLKIIGRAEKEVDTKILESESELKKLRKILQDLKMKDN